MTSIWILGDQLGPHQSALAQARQSDDVILFIESKARGATLRYHQQKLVLLYSAMRHRAEELKQVGWRVDYHELTDDYETALRVHLKKFKSERILVMEPSEYTMAQVLPKLARKLGVTFETVPTNQFLVSREDFSTWAGESKHVLMESHYRRQRKTLGILMEKDGQPVGGSWNLDHENRHTAKEFTKQNVPMPATPAVKPDAITKEVIAMVRDHFPNHPGRAEQFWLPVTRTESLAWLQRFVWERLEHFGAWEDMMIEGQPILFHSVLTPMLNLGLLTPQECVAAAVDAYEKKRAPLNSVEGFVRQIIGWREFINGIYWHRMPGYTELNELEAKRDLPAWIYTGKTEMNCLRQSIQQALDLGYNHHIQRLMVLGNFFLLGGFAPKQVLRWYLEMYVDAYDWVMAGNVLGMVLYADGGYLATKPYAAGSGYIQRMSNYCTGCRYRPEVKTGPEACPFNYLYWNFFATHEARFAKNPRVGMMIQTLKKKSPVEREAIQREAENFLQSL